MGLFSTRNSDGASGIWEGAQTITSKRMADLKARAIEANPDKSQPIPTTPAGRAYRNAHRIDKAGEN